jgi:hypothetical protein
MTIDLKTIVKMQMAEIARLRAEIDSLVGWIMGDADALACLQAIYSNPHTQEANRLKAAASALPFERSKPASVVALVDWREKTRTIRLRQMELDKARWAAEAKVIEHQPKLDLEAPTPPTILGEGETDPAA